MFAHEALSIAGLVLAVATGVAAVLYRRSMRRPFAFWLWSELWLTLWMASLALRGWLTNDWLARPYYASLAISIVLLFARIRRVIRTRRSELVGLS